MTRPLFQAPEDPTMAEPAGFFEGWDHLEFWVGNARAFTGWMAAAFGFDVVAYAGPETGVRDRASYVLEQGAIRFVVTGPLGPTLPHRRARTSAR